MKDKDINIAIAEACGWTHHSNRASKHAFEWESPNSTYMSAPPSYTYDLNAMHKAEKVLTFDQSLLYADYLTETTEGLWADHKRRLDCARATAAQRAEAFLRTINKWEEL